jgi:hypothetical protein
MPSQLTFRHLRLADAACVQVYLQNTRLWRKVGNEAFADHVRGVESGVGQVPVAADVSAKPVWLYHSWLPRTIELTAEQAGMIRALIQGAQESTWTPQQQEWTRALDGLGWLTDSPVDVDCLVTRALTEIIAIQNRYELREYLGLVQQLRPRVVVEIGTARGGMLFCLIQLAAPDAFIVSIDLPGAPNCGGQTAAERTWFSSFIAPGQQVAFIPSNSHFHATREALRRLLGGRKADVIFIDGDHSYGGVKIDFDMYAEFIDPRGLLTLHDICLRPEHWGAGNDVGLVWDEIRRTHEVQEIVDPTGMCQPDRPEGVEASWGIGIVRQKRGA